MILSQGVRYKNFKSKSPKKKTLFLFQVPGGGGN